MAEQEDVKSIGTTLIIYLLIFAMKLVAYFMSGIMALLAEGLHTLSDIFVSGFLLIATIYSRRKPDTVHMFGYGRAQYVAALVAATLFISFTSFELYKEAIPRLFSREVPAYGNIPLALGVLVLSIAIAALPLVKFLRRRPTGPAAKAQFVELINDELGLLAATAGTLCVLWGLPLADPISAILVATIIAINAITLFKENASYLVGKAPPEEFLDHLRSLALSVPGVMEVHDMRAERVAADAVHCDVHIRVASSLTIAEAHAIAVRVDDTLETVLKKGMCQVHVDAGTEGGEQS